ncbi:hypothetical protein [Nonomuraea sp. NPDC005650]|uniref:hypothetical protein n=1 Tax=Nonomuraea sp. NPDC005650 TaxID=3157045 RepID=UPI0033B4ED44
MMAFGGWTASRASHYGTVDFFGLLLVTLIGGGLLLIGLGPFASWLPGIVGRHAERLPLPVRLAARDLAGRRAAAAPAITLTMVATASGLALAIIATGVTEQSRAAYVPQARPGTLLVGYFSPEQAGAVRAAIQRELPGAPVIQRETWKDDSLDFRHFDVRLKDVYLTEESMYPAEAIGDERLLRYLTGDPTTPYDEGTAVVITAADVKADSVDVDYDLTGKGEPETVKTIPATVVRTAHPQMETIFVPAKVMRDIGYRLRPDELIVDPSLRRVSAGEQERLDDRLGELADTYIERGYQPSTGWMAVAGAAFLAALGCAWVAGGGRSASSRPVRVLRRVGGGSAATFRWFGASRTGLGALCGTALGAVAGFPIGMSLVWPLTAPTTWISPPQVSFEPPWLTIAAVIVGLPVLAAALGGLLGPARKGP